MLKKKGQRRNLRSPKKIGGIETFTQCERKQIYLFYFCGFQCPFDVWWQCCFILGIDEFFKYF
jgi:hypothetical protein